MDRRTFLKTSVAGAGAIVGLRASGAMGASQEAPASKPKAALKLSSQEGRLPGRSLREKIENLRTYGGVGLEVGGGVAGRVGEYKNALKGTGVAVSAVCAGYFPLIDPKPNQRQKGARKLKDMLSVAGELESSGVIVVPAFNRHPQLLGKEARDALVDILPGIGEHAAKCGTRVLFEPLNRKEAYFLRQLADAASICRDAFARMVEAGTIRPNADSPIAMMGDFYHMHFEETSDCGAFLSGGRFLHHVHLASIKRVLPGQDKRAGLDRERSFVDGFRGLKMVGYRDYCSLECGVAKGTRPEEAIPRSFRFLLEQWEQAVV